MFVFGRLPAFSLYPGWVAVTMQGFAWYSCRLLVKARIVIPPPAPGVSLQCRAETA